MAKVFIDGQAGTTGLQISQRLARRTDLTLLEIDQAQRKSDQARAALMREADVTILCLPDDAARQAVALGGASTRFLDASTAHRTAADWVYGLPELSAAQRTHIAGAARVSNPGCYPQGLILCLRPLLEADLLPRDLRVSIHAVSGYSGGGRPLIERFQAMDEAERERLAVQSYGLQLAHKHIPEMHAYTGLAQAPLFTPMVGAYYQGMLTQIPLFLDTLTRPTGRADIHELLQARYAAEPFIRVLPLDDEQVAPGGFLDATTCNDTNRMDIMIFGNDRQALLVARYDNLGKGAAGTAVQNLNLMLGCAEAEGLAP